MRALLRGPPRLGLSGFAAAGRMEDEMQDLPDVYTVVLTKPSPDARPPRVSQDGRHSEVQRASKNRLPLPCKKVDVLAAQILISRAAQPKWGRRRRGWGKANRAAKKRTECKAHTAARKKVHFFFASVRQLG